MELTQYVQDAIRTESRIETVQTSQRDLLLLLDAYVVIGNLLDDIKKNVFYGKEIKQEKWLKNLQLINQIVPYITDDPNQSNKQDLNIDPRLFHAIIGIATESTELVEAIITAITAGDDIDHVNVQEELGDLNWYQAIAVDASGADWDAILETNIAKLRARYPEKFTAESAINRNLHVERQILESGRVGA